MSKKREKTDAEWREQSAAPAPQLEAIIKKIPFFGTKYVRQPDVPLELDFILAEVLRDFERETDAATEKMAELKRQIDQNNLAKVKIISKILKLNGLTLRPGTFPTWQDKNSNIIMVPVPDELAKPKDDLPSLSPLRIF